MMFIHRAWVRLLDSHLNIGKGGVLPKEQADLLLPTGLLVANPHVANSEYLYFCKNTSSYFSLPFQNTIAIQDSR